MALGFVGDILGAAVDAATSYHNAKVQKDINQKNHQWALEAEERERAYNSPVAQMSRLKAAGLNPNLIYGSSGNTGNLHARTATAEAPQFKFSVLDAMRTVADLKNTHQTLSNLKAQEELNKSQKAAADATAEVGKANSRILNAKGDIAEHDAAVVLSRPDMLSTESVKDAVGRDIYGGLRGRVVDFFSGKDTTPPPPEKKYIYTSNGAPVEGLSPWI